jgi:glycerol uptake facilitator-like aquaporin
LYLRDNGLTEIPSIILRTITHLTSIHLSGYVQNPALFTGNRVC